MATSAADIVILRGFIREPDDSNGWTDARLTALIDANSDSFGIPDLRAAAADVWTSKAADSAVLVDVSENGSSRKLSDVHKNALAMAKLYRGESAGLIAVLSTRPRTRAITRP